MNINTDTALLNGGKGIGNELFGESAHAAAYNAGAIGAAARSG